jgi:hypothetical protein
MTEREAGDIGGSPASYAFADHEATTWPGNPGRSGAQEPPLAWDHEIRIEERDRVTASSLPALNLGHRPTAILAGAALLILGLGLGWIGGSSWGALHDEPVPLEVRQAGPPADAPDPILREMKGPATDLRPPPAATGRAHETAPAKHKAAAPPAGSAEKLKVSTRPTPVPETKPITIDGWTVREVNGGSVVLEGPNGVWRASRGDTVPGVGRIESIVRWGNHLIVATSKGLISTR